MFKSLLVLCATITLTYSIETYASPLSFFSRACSSLMEGLSLRSAAKFHGTAYVPPADAHATHHEVFEAIVGQNLSRERHYYLPYVEQSLERFKDTDQTYLRYYFEGQTLQSEGRKDFIENTAEIIFTPHASYHGHIRLRLQNQLYGFETVKRTFRGRFDANALFKNERKLKRGKKEGNIGVAFTLTPDQLEVLKARKGEIEQFYESSERYNIPPFDGSGAAEVKILVDEQTGRMTYKSPTSRSSFGNHAEITGRLVQVGDQEFLEAPNGYRHLVTRNGEGERVTKAYSCASSASHVLTHILGIDVKEMPYAGSFMTHLKNGAEGHLTPDAILYYYPSSDL